MNDHLPSPQGFVFEDDDPVASGTVSVYVKLEPLTAEQWQGIVDRESAGDEESAVADRAALLRHVWACVEHIRDLPQWLETEEGSPVEVVERRRALRLLIPCACPD